MFASQHVDAAQQVYQEVEQGMQELRVTEAHLQAAVDEMNRNHRMQEKYHRPVNGETWRGHTFEGT